MKREAEKANQRWYYLFYFLGLFILISIVGVIFLTRTNNHVAKKTENFLSIENQWKLSLADKETVDTKQLGRYFEEGKDTLSLYWKIPESELDEYIIYRSKDVYTRVYIDDKLFFETQYFDSPLYNRSPGNNWNFVLVPSKLSGKIVKLQIKYVYDTDAVSVDNICWGSKSSFIISMLKKKGLAIFISLLMLFLGVVCILISFTSLSKYGVYGLLHLGIYSSLLGIWSLIETNTIQFYMIDGRAIQMLDNIIMIVDSIPLFFYLDREYDLFRKLPFKVFFVMDLVYMWFCIIGQISGIADFHMLLIGSSIAICVSMFLLLVVLKLELHKILKLKLYHMNSILKVIGLVVLSVMITFNTIKYNKFDCMDRGEYIRFGMLVMIGFFAFASQLKTINLLKNGIHYDEVKNLAFRDGLTGLFNKTSYLHKINAYGNENPEKLGMIFFDVNNLKFANDTYGHNMGDRLICASANIIKSSFKDFGKAYRIGGDEFCVFLEDKEPFGKYKKGYEIFKDQIKSLNSSKEFPFDIVIAHGFAEADNIDAIILSNLIEEADSNMYMNKEELKKIVRV